MYRSRARLQCARAARAEPRLVMPDARPLAMFIAEFACVLRLLPHLVLPARQARSAAGARLNASG